MTATVQPSAEPPIIYQATDPEMVRKRRFYKRYGVEPYYNL